MHFPALDGNNGGAARDFRKPPDAGGMKWKTGVAHFLLKWVRKSLAWGEAEAGPSEGHAHIHVGQQSTEETEVASEIQGGLALPARARALPGNAPTSKGSGQCPCCTGNHW